MNVTLFLQLTLNGIMLGVFYATMALGFSTIWGVMRLINLAHGEFLFAAAYLAWFFFNPTREQQSLIIGGGDPEEVGSVVQVVFAGATVIVAVILSEMVFADRFRQIWRRRVACLFGTGAASYLIYSAWHNSNYRVFEISMMNMTMGGLALSFGFIFSHFLLPEAGRRFNLSMLGNIWVRRVIGYALGAALAWLIHLRWEANGYPALDPFTAMPLVLVIFFALGYVLQRGLFNRLVEGPYLTMLLVTFGVKIILINLGLRIYTANPRKIHAPYALENYQFLDGDLTLAKMRLYVLFMGFIIMALLWLFYKKTRVGYAIRAAAQHKMAARLVGIDIQETYAITFALSLAITAASGVVMGTFIPMTPIMGDPWTLRAFSIVALGGFGNIQGVLAGGLVLGLVESYAGGYISTGLASAAAFILLVLTLVFRPQGITGGLKPEED